MPAGAVEFSRTCEDHKGLPIFPVDVSRQVKYRRCVGCGFVWTPELCAWPRERFKEQIYNEDYPLADPDYLNERPKANAALLVKWFAKVRDEIRHIDYGAGNGQLSRCLACEGFNTTAWEPMEQALMLDGDRQFNLVTAFEVFEHCPDPKALRADLTRLMAPESLLVFSTLTSDSLGHDWHPGEWWYAAPRNGHVALYSKLALRQLLYPLRVFHLSEGLHFAFSTCPKWVEVSVQ